MFIQTAQQFKISHEHHWENIIYLETIQADKFGKTDIYINNNKRYTYMYI